MPNSLDSTNDTSSQTTQQASTQKSKKPTQPKNLWPYGILLVILLGVVLISVSIRISVQNPVVDDVPFFIKHDDMDFAINDLLESTKALEEDFDFFIQANTTPTNDKPLRPYSPYMRPPHRDKSANHTQTTLHTKSLNTLFLRVISKKEMPQDLHIEAFIQKIGNLYEQEIFIYNPKDNSYTSAKPSKKGAQIAIGELVKQHAQDTQSKTSKNTKESKEVDFIYASPFFMLELEGRWIVSLQISDKRAKQHNKAQDNDDPRKVVVLEKEFFALPNASTDSDDAKSQNTNKTH